MLIYLDKERRLKRNRIGAYFQSFGQENDLFQSWALTTPLSMKLENFLKIQLLKKFPTLRKFRSKGMSTKTKFRYLQAKTQWNLVRKSSIINLWWFNKLPQTPVPWLKIHPLRIWLILHQISTRDKDNTIKTGFYWVLTSKFYPKRITFLEFLMAMGVMLPLSLLSLTLSNILKNRWT